MLVKRWLLLVLNFNYNPYVINPKGAYHYGMPLFVYLIPQLVGVYQQNIVSLPFIKL